MSNIAIPTSFSPLTQAKSAEVNANFTEIATKFNTFAVQTDVAKTITVSHTQAADLLFSDALYDIGKSGATRPRDGFFSRNVTLGGNLTVAGTISGSISNAATATALQTPRAINGVAFDGTAAITITAAAATLTGNTLAAGVTGSSLTSVGTLTALTMGGTASFVGNVADRPKMQAYTETVATPAISGGTLTLDLSTANVFRVSWNANITTLTLSNVPTTGQLAEFTLILDQTGAFTISLPASFRPLTGTAGSFSGVASKTDTLSAFTTDGGTKVFYSLAAGATT